MTSPPPASAEKRAAGAAGDDIVLPFKTEQSGVLGHVVRLGAVADTILSRHDYPGPVNALLGEAIALTAMLGVALKFDGKLIVQTKTDGPVGMIVVNFEAPGFVRGYASFDKELWSSFEAGGEKPETAVDQGKLIGKGHLALTIDPGQSRERYQGIVGLDGETLTEAALGYFRQSEQLPTFVRLAVARQYIGGEGGGWHWRAGGIMLQYLKSEQEIIRREAANDDDEARLPGEEDDDWQRVQILAATVDDHELIDPLLSPERLLLRLFHEEGVRVFEPRRIVERCRCSKERVAVFLQQFGAAELADMREPDGAVTVTCEFCSSKYRFEPGEIT